MAGNQRANSGGDSRGRRTLVTGGAGFIGSHLVERLIARGDAVTVVDNLSTGRRENLPESHPLLRFIEADLAEALPALGRGETFDEIYHLAAAVGVKLIVDEPIASIDTNIEQTAALFRFAASRGGGGAPARVLMASSSEVYGKSSKTPFGEDDDVVYGPTTVARWSYACSKAIDEHLAIAYHRRHGLGSVVVRFFNTVGPRQVGTYGMVLPRFVEAALEGRDLMIHGDGSQTRCFGDVRDVSAALPRLMANEACHGRVFNLGSDRPISIAALAELVVRVLGSGSAIRRMAYEEAYGAGFEDLRQRQPDLRRVREAIGFEASTPLERTILDIADTMRGGGLQGSRARGGGVNA